jgi:hypothetical protein
MCRKIQIIKSNHLPSPGTRPQLIIRKRIRCDGTPDNVVWIYGNLMKASLKLFYVGATCWINTRLGEEYGAMLAGLENRYVITKPNNLKRLCRKLGIRQIIIIQFREPDLDNLFLTNRKY